LIARPQRGLAAAGPRSGGRKTFVGRCKSFLATCERNGPTHDTDVMAIALVPQRTLPHLSGSRLHDLVHGWTDLAHLARDAVHQDRERQRPPPRWPHHVAGERRDRVQGTGLRTYRVLLGPPAKTVTQRPVHAADGEVRQVLGPREGVARHRA